MDIHRCRFVDYSPSTINAVAFSQSHTSREKKVNQLRLAIGRANGDIEIWNPLCGAWVQETILRGGKGRSVDGLAWIQDPEEKDVAGKPISGRLRLFSIGYTTTITEWDLEKGQPLRQASGNHGEIWCLAAQPPVSQFKTELNTASATTQWQGQHLVTGCTDGAVVLYSTEGEDLRLEKILARPSAKKAKVISITFRDRSIVVAGCTDSTIRIYDIGAKTVVKSMSLGTGPAGGPREIIVWAVKCLPNGTIVSGDSTGELRIWDAKTFTLVQRIISHKQDILSLGTSMDGSIILSGGMDRRTVIYKRTGGPKARWGEVSHRRFHSHDVKTMTTFEGNGMSVVVSGGPDASPIVVPLREFGRENHRTLPCLPQMPILQSASKKRLLVSWWDREVHIWKIHETFKSQLEDRNPHSESETNKRSRRLVAKVMIKGEANITSASITSDGSLLAVSTSAEIKIFRLKSLASNEEGLRVSKLDICVKLSRGGGRLLQFSPDGKWLCVVRRDSQVITARIHRSGSNSVRILSIITELNRVDRNLEKRELLGGLGAYERMVSRLAFSSDSRILAASDLAGYVDTWVLEGHEDMSEAADDDMTGNGTSLPYPSDQSDSGDEEIEKSAINHGQHWIRNPMAASIPKLPTMALVLAFRPSPGTANKTTLSLTTDSENFDRDHRSTDIPMGEDRLIVATAGGAVFEFAVSKGALSAWSRKNPTANFPSEFKNLMDQPMGCLWDFEGSRQRLWLYGSTWMWMFDISRDLPNDSISPGPLSNGEINGHEVRRQHSRQSGKRKRDEKHGFRSDEWRRGTSGAGRKIADEFGTGMSRNHEEARYQKTIMRRRILDHRQRRPSMDLDQGDEQVGGIEESLPLERLRQVDDAALPHGNGRIVATEESGGEAERSVPHWHTYKYRPIMGIVPIDGKVGLEVVLVERPSWEMDLPPNYYGDQEWGSQRRKM